MAYLTTDWKTVASPMAPEFKKGQVILTTPLGLATINLSPPVTKVCKGMQNIYNGGLSAGS